MCPSCQIDMVVALLAVSFAMTLYMLFRRGIMGKGKSLQNVAIVVGLLVVVGVGAGIMTDSGHHSHATAQDIGSPTSTMPTVDNPKPSEAQPATSGTGSGDTTPATPTMDKEAVAGSSKVVLATVDRACRCTQRRCQAWAGIVNEVAGRFDRVVVERIDKQRDAKRYRELCRTHGVNGVPLAFVFGPDGAFIEAFRGNLRRDKLEQAITKAMGGPAAAGTAGGTAVDAIKAFAEGKAFLAEADFAAALNSFQTAARNDGKNQEYAQQYAMLRQVLQMRRNCLKEKSTERWLKMAAALRTFYYEHGLYSEALPLDQERHQRHRSAQSATMLAETQLAMDMESQTVEMLGCLTKKETSPRTRVLHGLALARLGQTDMAKQAAEQPQQVTDDVGPRYFYDLARLRAAVEDANGATSALTHTFELTPRSQLEALKAEVKKCKDFSPLVNTPGFAQALNTPSKIDESACSQGSACGDCPQRAACGQEAGNDDKGRP